MRRLLVAVVVIAALWVGYWFGAAYLLARGAEGAFAARAEGPRLTQEGLAVTGFPTRFDLSVTEPRVTDATGAAGWTAPSARVTTRAFAPWRAVLDLPERQTVTLPGQEITLNSSAMTATVAVTPGTTLPLDTTEVNVAGLTLDSSAGWTVAVARILGETRRAAGDPLTHDVTLEASSITPDVALRRRLATLSDLPELVDSAKLNAALTFSAPLDRNAAEMQPRLTALRLRDATLTWGRLVLSAQGQLAPDAEGRAEGRIDMVLQGWRDLVPVLVAAQLIKPEVAPTVTRALEVVALQGAAAGTPAPDRLELPLVLAEGWMRLGPIPLGPAPMLR